ncbi:helix-turn-helix domain-containing protein [Flavonifractor plautii]|nr:helix-turn-helix domain-containing protein [Flavonifractor plautii]
MGRWLVFYNGVQITGRHVVDELTIGQRSYNEAFGVTDPWRGRRRRPAPPPRRPHPGRPGARRPGAGPGLCRGNRALAARVLGISRTALYQKLERFRLS